MLSLRGSQHVFNSFVQIVKRIYHTHPHTRFSTNSFSGMRSPVSSWKTVATQNINASYKYWIRRFRACFRAPDQNGKVNSVGHWCDTNTQRNRAGNNLIFCALIFHLSASVSGPCSLVPMPLLYRLVARASTRNIYRFGWGEVVNICSEDDNDGNYHGTRGPIGACSRCLFNHWKLSWMKLPPRIRVHVLHDARGGDGVLSFAA